MTTNQNYMVSQTLFRRLTIVVSVLFTLVLLGLMFYIPAKIQIYSENRAIEQGTDTLKQFSILRSYYTENVINKIISNDEFIVGHNHKNNKKTIPLPATLIKDLSEQYQNLGIEIKLYSPYQFRTKRSTPLNKIEYSIWNLLNQDPSSAYNKTNKQKVSIAIADIMTSQSCVDCHNTHSLSPKRDWNLGDVRGVLQIDIDISRQIEEAYDLSYSIVAILVVLLICVFGFIFFVFRKEEFEIMNFYKATHDPLTKLYNRSFFLESLELALNQVDRHQYKLSLSFIDLDGFKEINDKHGHDAGDQTLIEVAKRLKKCVREVDTIARLGGDEFAVLMVDLNQENISQAATRMNESISRPIAYQEKTLNVSCSIGIAIAPDNSCDNTTLMQMSDKAMYQAKMAGKNTFKIYTPDDTK